MLTVMSSFVSQTQPAELLLAVRADHMHAAGVFENRDAAFWAVLCVGSLPLDVQLVDRLFDLFPPLDRRRAVDRLVPFSHALEAVEVAASAAAVLAGQFALGVEI